MNSLPELPYWEIIHALQRDGWVVIRQQGSQIRLQKHTLKRTLKLIIPAHKPVLRTTLGHTLKQAEIDLDRFLKLL